MTRHYRADIDGLRAVAILPVLFFHFKLPFFEGGFVGVDVFFVISGFLITNIIARELKRDNFSFSNFWLRRVRRIFPALFSMVIVVGSLSWIFIPVGSIRAVYVSILSICTFSSNLYFWRHANSYFLEGELSPFLHTWSIAIEEQFYLFFPLLLWALFKCNRKTRTYVIFSLLLVSFVLCLWGTHHFPAASFYLLPTRAWELLLGALLALLLADGKFMPKGNGLSEVVSIFGLTSILFSVFVYDQETSFPGYSALFPAFGAAFIIWSSSTNKTYVGKILSFSPFVYIGLISYSLYLWHWPIKVFLTQLQPSSLGPVYMVKICGVLASLLFAILSYYFIETPFRKKIVFSHARKLSLAALACVLSVAAFSVTASSSNIIKKLMPQSLLESQRYLERYEKHELVQMGQVEIKSFYYAKDREKNFLVWGDSHSRALTSSLLRLAERHGVNIDFISRSECGPVVGMVRISSGEKDFSECLKFNKKVFEYSLKKGYKNIFLAYRFNWHLNPIEKYDLSLGKKSQLLTENLEDPPSLISARKGFKLNFSKMLDEWQSYGLKVHVMGQVPNYNFDPSAFSHQARILGRELPVGRLKQELLERGKHFREVILNKKINFLDPLDVFCNSNICSPFAASVSLYADDDHVNIFGAKYLEPLLEQRIFRIRNRAITEDRIELRHKAKESLAILLKNQKVFAPVL